MIRSRILDLKLHRNIILKNGLTSLVNKNPTSNLKQQNLNPFINDIFSKNYSIFTFRTTQTLSPIASNAILLNSPQTNQNNRVSLNETKTRHFSHSTNYAFTKCNTSHTSSTSLLAKHNCIAQSRIKPMGVRHLSDEATGQLRRPVLTGIWKDMSESAPVEFVQDSLISFQTTTNLPWWATVIITTLIVRSTMTLPLSLYQHYILAKVQNLQVEMREVVQNLKIEANIAVAHHKWNEHYTRMVYDQAVKKKWTELIQRENCHPAKGFIVLWTQIPLWITISAALRNLCYMLPPSHENAEKIYLELTTGGFGWVTNLIDVDHLWILPVSIGVFNLANVEVMTLLKLKEDTRLQKYLLFFFRFISIAMVPIATYVPSCICLYWASSSAFGLVQNLILLSPKVRRLGRVPLTETERQHPYRDLVQKFRAKKYFTFGGKAKNLG